MRATNHTNLYQKGFSLVELLVGLVIGLLATLVIMQTFAAFEGQKRTTSGNADAQTNGSIALMNIQRNVQMAGYGLPLPMANKDDSSLKCAAITDFDPDSDAATDNSVNIAPIVVQDGAANSSDTITVRYSTTAAGAVPVTVNNFANATSTGLYVDNNIGCKADDIALINGGSCEFAVVKSVPDPAVDSTHIILKSSPTIISTPASIACMGNWQNYTFQVVNNELRLNGRPIVSDVVALQAQYGVSATPESNQVNAWVDASGATWTNPSVDDRNRIKAIRVAIVMRNGLLEKENVTNQCTTANGVVNNGPCAWDDTDYSNAPKIDLSADANWQRYRYRVFETIIPLRNVLWSKEAV